MMNRLTNLLVIIPLLTACNADNGTSDKIPEDNTPITIQVSEGINTGYEDFKNLGYQQGEKVPDLKLYTPDGLEFSMNKTLATGRPLILVSGSYTCDISRSNLPEVNTLGAKYADNISIYHVYTVDAHPADKFCPYSPNQKMDIPAANIRDKIEANQPKTYGERRILARKWQDENNIAIPVLVDKPTNDYWMTFGQAPNTAYLIAPDGEVFYKQVWFKYQDFDRAIKDLLQILHRKIQ